MEAHPNTASDHGHTQASTTPETKSQSYLLNTNPNKMRRSSTDAHDGEVKCPFPDCGKMFPDEPKMKSHYRMHKPKSLTCNIDGCGKTFRDGASLRRHRLSHTGERPYKCDFCSKTFSLKYNKKVHMRKHTGEMPYKCNFPGCERSFMYNVSCKSHFRIHIKEILEKSEGEAVTSTNAPKSLPGAVQVSEQKFYTTTNSNETHSHTVSSHLLYIPPKQIHQPFQSDIKMEPTDLSTHRKIIATSIQTPTTTTPPQALYSSPSSRKIIYVHSKAGTPVAKNTLYMQATPTQVDFSKTQRIQKHRYLLQKSTPVKLSASSSPTQCSM
eukprot:m.22056 g.22056  ORF g.22056 m.22056 type:complete len:325 (+) comp7332_c0_seq1:91-1065(+)